MKVSTNLEHADEKFPTLMSGQNWLKPKVPNFADDLETRSPRGKVPNFNVQLQPCSLLGRDSGFIGSRVEETEARINRKYRNSLNSL